MLALVSVSAVRQALSNVKVEVELQLPISAVSINRTTVALHHPLPLHTFFGTDETHHSIWSHSRITILDFLRPRQPMR